MVETTASAPKSRCMDFGYFNVVIVLDIFVAAALMEYYCTKDAKIAGNIFELGFKKFKNNPEYILEYLDFLSHLNETNNTRWAVCLCEIN